MARSLSVIVAAVASASTIARASIVYVPDGSSLMRSYDAETQPPAPPEDLNFDGVLDTGFNREASALGGTGSFYYHYTQVITGGSGYSHAAMTLGNPVGAATPFDTVNRELGFFSVQYIPEPPYYSYSGAIDIPDGNSYWGLKFVGPGGVISYGWMQLYAHAQNVSTPNGFVTAAVVDYAYETTPGTAIPVGAIPAPSGILLALLGLGALPRRR
jgi:hypothetical protein